MGSNFLYPMEPSEAEDCTAEHRRDRKPGGYLFVTGIDLDVRTKAARDLCLRPGVRSCSETGPSTSGEWSLSIKKETIGGMQLFSGWTKVID